MARKPAVKKEAKKPVRKSERPPQPRVVAAAIPAVEGAPKKATKAVKKAAPKKAVVKKGAKGAHPPRYESMIKRALKGHATKDEPHPFVSLQKIAKYVHSNFPVSDQYLRFLKQALATGVDNHVFIKRRASFRLSAAGGRKRKVGGRSRSRSPARSKSPARKEKGAKKEKAGKEKGAASPRKKKAAVEGKEKAPAAKRKAPGAGREKEKEKAPKKSRVSKKPTGEGKKEMAAEAAPKGNKFDHYWQYEDNGWKNYDPKAAETVEEVYQNYLKNKGDNDVRAVRSGQWEYQVDFLAMKQMNIQHDNHTVRNIRRVPVSS